MTTSDTLSPTAPGAAEARPRTPRLRLPATLPRRRPGVWAWLGIGGLVWVLVALFALATAPASSPDEPSHAIRAAAVARGQWSGVLLPASPDIEVPGAATVVHLPADWAGVAALPDCFIGDAGQAADCQVPLGPPADAGGVDVETYAGQYPPLYYALVGLPSLFLPAWPALTAMRLVSTTLTAAFVSWGLFRLSRIPGNRAGVWGAAIALTPMTLFLGASVNPAGFEIVAAFSFWAAALALATGAGPPSRGALVQAAVGGAVLVNSRFTGPVWAVGIVAVVLVLAPTGRLRELVRSPGARGVGLTAALASAVAVGWLAVHPQVVTTENRYPQFADPALTLRFIVGKGVDYLANMVGDFGWLDTPAPPLTWLLWTVATGAVVLLGLAVARGRRRPAALVLVVAATAAAPVVLQFPWAVDAGIVWQGRYALPLAMGIPLVAALVAGIDDSPVGEVVRRVARATVPLLAVAHVAAFATAARRYAVGVGGEFVTREPAWSSPVGYLTALVAFALVATVLAAVAWRSLGPRQRELAALS